jgi:hypothetical protein
MASPTPVSQISNEPMVNTSISTFIADFFSSLANVDAFTRLTNK